MAMDVTNVNDFPRLENESDDAPRIQRAVDSIPDQGGILYFPPGDYYVAPRPQPWRGEPYGVCVALRDRIWVLGAGAASVIKAEGNLVMFAGLGVSHIRVSNLSFLIDILNSDRNNFVSALSLLPYSPDPPDLENDPPRGVSDIVIDSCSFEAVNVPWGGLTLHAVMARAVKRLWVINNQVRRMQIKTAAGSSLDVPYGNDVVGPTVIADNYIFSPHNLGIGALHRGLEPTLEHPDQPPTGEILDMIIANNLIEDPQEAGGIAVGADGDISRIKSLKRIVIRDNIIKGSWTGGGQSVPIGINIHQATESENILVEGNVIEGDITGPVVGINVDICIWPTKLKALVISNNTVRNTNPHLVLSDRSIDAGQGVRVHGDQELSNFAVSGNRLENTTGISLRRGIIRDGIIAANFTTKQGLFLQTLQEGDRIGPVLVRDNIFKNGDGGADGITLDAQRPGTFISADFIGNKCYDDREPPLQPYGIREIGLAENFDTRYLDNDVRRNATAGLRLISNALARNNRGWQGSMSHIADFKVLKDRPFDLRVGDAKAVPESGSFLLPADAALVGEWAILAFLVDPSNDAEDLAYEIWINAHRIRSGGLSGGVSRGLWETFNAEILLCGEGVNTADFRVVGGRGSVKIADVVLWFQRKVAEAPRMVGG